MTADAMPAVPEPRRPPRVRACCSSRIRTTTRSSPARCSAVRWTPARRSRWCASRTPTGRPARRSCARGSGGLGTDPARVHFLGFDDDPEDRRQGRSTVDEAAVLAGGACARAATRRRGDAQRARRVRAPAPPPRAPRGVRRVPRRGAMGVRRGRRGSRRDRRVRRQMGGGGGDVRVAALGGRDVRAGDGGLRGGAPRRRPGGRGRVARGRGRGAADGRARRVPSDGAGVVRADARAADAAAGARVAGDRDGRARARGRADRLGQDARGVPHRPSTGCSDRVPTSPTRRGCSTSRRSRRSATTCRRTCSRRSPPCGPSTRRCPRCACSCAPATRPRRSARR